MGAKDIAFVAITLLPAINEYGTADTQIIIQSHSTLARMAYHNFAPCSRVSQSCSPALYVMTDLRVIHLNN